MADRIKNNLVADLLRKNAELDGSIKILGKASLTFPQYVNSMRTTMFASHLNQFVNLTKPEFPAVFTNAENAIGENCSSYEKTEDEYTVYKAIRKYSKITDCSKYGVIFLYDAKHDKYSLVECAACENLTEVFGFDYMNTILPTAETGDTIPKGTVIYKSSSYDDDMNYGFGKNVVTMNSLDEFSSEDACIISESLSKEMTSLEVYSETISVNSNHYLCNYYGDEDTYQGFPNIGEYTKNDVLCAKRTLHIEQILNDFKDTNLRKINYATDEVTYSKGEVIDIEVYNNNDDIKENSFNKQMLKYLDAQTKYYKEIHKTCDKIIKSGSKYDGIIGYWFKRSGEYINTDYKWKDEEHDGVFSNIQIKFTIRRVVPLDIGQKITGRYGNKSIIADIRKDEDMPHLGDGTRVDLIVNALAIVNRTIAMVPFENTLTFMSRRISKYAQTLATYEEKERVIFDFIGMVNKNQAYDMYAKYNELSYEKQHDYIDECINDRIYLHPDTLSDSEYLFNKLHHIYEVYHDILKPDKVYVHKFGRRIKIANNMPIGEMYVLKLKQTSRKNHSSRSTGAVNMEGLPERSYKSKSHRAVYSDTPIRFGEYETLNFLIGMTPDELALFTSMYRSSIKGRRDLATLAFHPDGGYEIDSSYTSRVNEILGVYLKYIGMRINIDDEKYQIKEYDTKGLKEYNNDDGVYLATSYDIAGIEEHKAMEKQILDAESIMDADELEDAIDAALASDSIESLT